MFQPDLRQAEPDRRGIGQEQVGPVPDLGSDAVLQQSVCDVDGGAEKIAPRADGLAHDVAAMQDHLEVERADHRTRGTDVVVRPLAFFATCPERVMDRPQLDQQRIAVPVERRSGRHREDGIAFELGDPEVGLYALDDGVEQRPDDPVSGRDAGAEVDAMGLAHAGHEGGIAGDVGQQQIAVDGGRGWLR